jgi:hypothetical protein
LIELIKLIEGIQGDKAFEGKAVFKEPKATEYGVAQRSPKEVGLSQSQEPKASEAKPNKN